jgi:hypothetical protein
VKIQIEVETESEAINSVWTAVRIMFHAMEAHARGTTRFKVTLPKAWVDVARHRLASTPTQITPSEE